MNPETYPCAERGNLGGVVRACTARSMPENWHAEWERLARRAKRAAKGPARWAAEKVLAAHEMTWGDPQ